MAVRISTAARSAACDAVVDLIDAGTDAGVLRIYTGSQPAGPASEPTGTLLAEVELNDPAFGSAANGVATLDVDPDLSTTGLEDGTAGWFRLCDSTEADGDGFGILDGSVTATGGGGDLTLATTTISTGLTVTITSGTISMPGE